MRRTQLWYKTRHTEPYVVPVRIFKANDRYVWPDTPIGSQTMRRLRISPETSYFPTEDEALAHVDAIQGAKHDRSEQPRRY